MSVQTVPVMIQQKVHLSPESASRLRRLATARGISEDLVVEKALDILFSLTDLVGDPLDLRDWSLLSEDALQRVWDNEADAVYDDWRSLYGVSAR